MKKYLKIILPILLGVFLIWYSFKEVALSELLVYFKEANYFWVLFGVFCGVLSHLSRAYRWKFLLDPLGYHVSFWNSAMAVFSGYLINYTIPRAGEVARASMLSTYEKANFEKVFGTIVAERVADLLMMILIIVCTLFIQFEFISEFFLSKLQNIWLWIALVVAVFVSLALFIYIKNASSIVANKIRGFISGLVEGIFSIKHMKNRSAFICHTIFIWLMYVLMFYVVTFSIPELQGISIAIVLLGFISASFSIAATNSGIGAYPLAIFAAFSIYGIDKEPSFAFGWIVWSSQTLMIVLLGGLSLICMPIYNRIKRE